MPQNQPQQPMTPEEFNEWFYQNPHRAMRLLGDSVVNQLRGEYQREQTRHSTASGREEAFKRIAAAVPGAKGEKAAVMDFLDRIVPANPELANKPLEESLDQIADMVSAHLSEVHGERARLAEAEVYADDSNMDSVATAPSLSEASITRVIRERRAARRAATSRARTA